MDEFSHQVSAERFSGQRLLENRLETIVLNSPPQQSCRVLHGRGRCYAGLEHISIDWFAPVLFVILHKCPDKDWLRAFKECLATKFTDYPEFCVLLQHRYADRSPTEILSGAMPDQVYATEGDWLFRLSFGETQNIGFFPDMAPGRQWVHAHSAGRKVLNLFAYTCSLSVAALVGGAHSVVNLDMSSGSLQTGRENHRLNGLQDRLSRDVTFLGHDLFRSWGRLKKLGPFDVLIVDPPSFQKGSFVARQDYGKVLKRLGDLCADNADVLLCVNDPHLGEDFLPALLAELKVPLRFVKRLANREDFPERDPERSVKMLHFVFEGQPWVFDS